ncbi:MAG: terminase small subunit protein, partial [Mesorhizobium sp.]
FCNQYTRAREMQADTHVDEMQDIADDGSNDYITKTNADGSTTEQVNSEHIQRSRLRIDTRKWVAERMRPKKYGSKVALT